MSSNYSVELRRIKNVFDFDYDFYDEHFKCDFEEKFCDHYAFHEIGFETIERFKHNLRSHLNLKMPYYSQLYETELAAQDLDFLLNKDYRETFLRTVDTEDKLNGNTTRNMNSETSGNATTDSDSNGKKSNIEDGVASSSLNEGYLTEVSTVNDHSYSANASTGSSNESSNNKEDKTGKLLEKTELIGKGNIGVTSSAELLEKWRNVLINLDEKIILECIDLFMGVF